MGAYEYNDCGVEGDSDGDGICDDEDNCPDRVNPAQADADGDGIGDICDPCPFLNDVDDDIDGVCNEVDNCPTMPRTAIKQTVIATAQAMSAMIQTVMVYLIPPTTARTRKIRTRKILATGMGSATCVMPARMM